MLMYDDLSTSSAPPEFLSSTLMTAPLSATTQHYLTIEELKLARNSCWLCGCNWQQDHASLDCPECDGYSLSRPCPNCDGKCKQVWKRNISGTHDHHRASWVGQCNMMLTAGSKDKVKQVRAFQLGSLFDSNNSSTTATSTPATTTAPTPTSKSKSKTKSTTSPSSTTTTSIPINSTTTSARGCATSTSAINIMGLGGSPNVVGPTASSVCSSAPSSAVSSDCESDSDFMRVDNRKWESPAANKISTTKVAAAAATATAKV